MLNDTEKQMNILVTGATGFLGSNIVAYLASVGFSILATGRKFSSDNKVHHPKVKYMLGDLSDLDFVQALFYEKIDVVINCASLSSIWGSKEAFYIANIVTQRYLISESQKHGISRFVYISTPSIYFNNSDSLDIKETDTPPEKKVNDYARTKFEAETMIKESGLDHIILRPRALIGKGDTLIMPRLIRAYDEGKLKMVGSGDNVVNLTSINNMVKAVRKSISTPHINEDYNITNGEPIKLWEAINEILALIGKGPVTKKVSYRLAYSIASIMEFVAVVSKGKKEPVLTRYSVGILAKSSTFDISKAQELLGYEVEQSTREALKDFADWYLSKKTSDI